MAGTGKRVVEMIVVAAVAMVLLLNQVLLVVITNQVDKVRLMQTQYLSKQLVFAVMQSP